MELKHTPGPWKTTTTYGLYGINIANDDEKHTVCSVPHVTKDVLSNEGKKIGVADVEYGVADARLIAAAPELLEALQDAVNLLTQISEDTDTPLALDKFCHVISKATGQ